MSIANQNFIFEAMHSVLNKKPAWGIYIYTSCDMYSYMQMYCVVDGIAGSCGEVCEELAKRTNKLTGEVCDVLCLIVGIDEFIRILDR